MQFSKAFFCIHATKIRPTCRTINMNNVLSMPVIIMIMKKKTYYRLFSFILKICFFAQFFSFENKVATCNCSGRRRQEIFFSFAKKSLSFSAFSLFLSNIMHRERKRKKETVCLPNEGERGINIFE